MGCIENPDNFSFYCKCTLREHLVTKWIPPRCGSSENTCSYRIKFTIFVNLWKAKVDTDARRQNSQESFHPLPNPDISDPHKIGGRDPYRTDYQMLPRGQFGSPLIFSTFSSNPNGHKMSIISVSFKFWGNRKTQEFD